jgi:hypothetical protein
MTPSPVTPKTMPSHDNAKHYAHVLFSLYSLKQTETDPLALKTIEDFIQFADQKYSDLALNQDEISELAPLMPPPPPMLQMPNQNAPIPQPGAGLSAPPSAPPIPNII